ncbi:Serine/arginine-rich splicing factor 12 [Chytriomyces hyalinus]|nr:Serine/arginine-rich splicing factor 12 [Chytriomyces hyalinus]
MANEDEEFKREMSVDEKTKDEVSESGRDRDRDAERGRDKDGDDKDKVRFGKDRRSDDVKSLFVRGLAQGTRLKKLATAVYIPKDYYSGGIKGFAYIQYESQAEADTAYDKIEYLTINGRRLTVEWASGDRKTPGQMRNKDGSRAGGSNSGSGGGGRRRSVERYRPRDSGRSRSRSRSRDRRRRSRSRYVIGQMILVHSS